MGHKPKKTVHFGTIIICILAIVLDVILVHLLKGISSWFRWLWLPIICCILSGIFSTIFEGHLEELGVKVLRAICVIWGVIRGIIVSMAYLQTVSGFFAILGALFLCIFIFALNGFVLIVGVLGTDDRPFVATTSTSATSSRAYSHDSDTSEYPIKKNIRAPSRPRQGDLSYYFNSSFCAPQGGHYFWERGPYMNSDFGSHSNYTVSGTIGIKAQSIEVFHVDKNDMYHHLSNVEYEVQRYINEITKKYRRDYPDDPTDFHISIELDLTVVSW